MIKLLNLWRKNYKNQAKSIKQARDISLKHNVNKFSQNITIQKIRKIVNSSCHQLALMLNEGKTTSVQLVSIFSRRSGTIGLQLEAITQDNFLQAFEMAVHCDKQRFQKGWKNATLQPSNKEQFSPLFGIPLSVKDAFIMKKFSCTIGLVSKYNQKAQNDGQIISVLKRAGLIPFIRTNVPPLLSTYSSGNTLWGISKNPWDILRTPGGSSGGEASLISAGCSVIGIGSDIGGSLRNPAQFCGICTIKPHSQRLIINGHVSFSPSIDSQSNIKCSMGPLTRDVEDLCLFMKIMCDKKYFKTQQIGYYQRLNEFDNNTYQQISSNSKKLRIGYFNSLEICPTTKASMRAVDQVVDILQKKGHIVKRISIPEPQQYIKLLMTQVFVQGLKGHLQTFNDEQLTKDYLKLNLINKIPRFMINTFSKILSKINPRISVILKNCQELTSSEYKKATVDFQKFKQQFYQFWNNQQLDFIICPGFNCQALLIDQQNDLGVYPIIYNYMWNILDYPVGSLPITICKQDQTSYQCKYNDSFTKSVIQSQKKAAGLPVGIQVVGLPFQQQKVLGLMKLIQKQVQFKNKYPYPMKF